MKQTIGFSQFIDAFRNYNRYDQFGYAALRSLFDYLEQYEDETGEEMELDVIAICCDYCVSDVATIAQDYNIDVEGIDEDEAKEKVIDYLNENTIIVDEDCEGNIIYCSSFQVSMMKTIYKIEVTDTFGGEANYSWVSHYVCFAKSMRGAIQWLSLNHGGNWRKDYDTGDMVRYNMKDACICAFIEEATQ